MTRLRAISAWPFLLLFLISEHSLALKETCKIAVASNFTTTAKALSADFDKSSGHKSLLSFGSTGKIFAQITHGAPFDVFLSADTVRPEALIAKGLALSGSDFVYALGQLVLWSPTIDVEQSHLSQLSNIVLANPKTAPYGYAANIVLERLSLIQPRKHRLIFANNTAQTMLFVASGNGDAGFLSLAQVKSLPINQKGYWWQVNPKYYPKLQHKAVILLPGKNKKCATDYVAYLKSPAGKKIIAQMGYNLPL